MGIQVEDGRRLDGLKPLLLDVAVPLGGYYLLAKGFGTGTVTALAVSSVVPAVRTVWGVVRCGRINALAALILIVNVVSLGLSCVTGDPRLMLAKDSGVSSVVGIGMIVSVVSGRPLLTAAIRPWLTRGDAERGRVWERLLAGDRGFRRSERLFTLVWGVALVAECAVRIVGAYTVPVDTMVWLGTVIMAGAMVLAFVVSRRVAAVPMARRMADELARGTADLAGSPVPWAANLAKAVV
ncbi:VC0807 family protein [Streptomyces sp. NPDC058045]|uniref:VC0807 family protein n=1 Tax=Streptomyces sp. NPDC058045 TaxID=3346311 RepID=UPI0036E6FFF4